MNQQHRNGNFSNFKSFLDVSFSNGEVSTTNDDVCFFCELSDGRKNSDVFVDVRACNDVHNLSFESERLKNLLRMEECMESLTEALQQYADKEKAILLQRFFKTGKGEYGDGDVFLGLTVPVVRSVAKKYYHLSLGQLDHHLSSAFHEERFASILILMHKYKTSWSSGEKKVVVDFYLSRAKRVNNWDFDGRSHHLGAMLDKNSSIPTLLLARSIFGNEE